MSLYVPFSDSHLGKILVSLKGFVLHLLNENIDVTDFKQIQHIKSLQASKLRNVYSISSDSPYD